MRIRELGSRIYDWIFNEHGVRRLSKEEREARQQSLAKMIPEKKPGDSDDGWHDLGRAEEDVKVGVDFGGDGSTHVAMSVGGRVVGSDQFLHCPHPFQEIYNRFNPSPRFHVGQLVIVHSSHHGDWAARIEDRRRLPDGRWRYEVSDQGLRVSYANSSPARRSDVPEDILESFSPSRANPQSPYGKGFPLNRMVGGLWAFSSPSMLSLPADLNPIKNAIAAREAYERAQKEGKLTLVHFDEVDTKDQETGLDLPDESQLEPLHREFLKTIRFLLARGDYEFAEQMRDDIVGLWHEDKVAKGKTLPEALGMTEAEYSHWVERKGKE